MSGVKDKLDVPLSPLLPRLELTPPHARLLRGCGTAREALSRLVAAGALVEASRLVAHALPRREAVWWACMCGRAVPDEGERALDSTALLAAEHWVRKPDDLARRAAMEAAQGAAFQSAEAWAAVGAFWSGGSMAPPGQPDVPPGPQLTGLAVAGAVLLAATRRRPERSAERLVRFLDAADSIAAGGAGHMEAEEG
jgi:hypothetical protein